MFCLVDKASGQRFKFGGGRLLGYSCNEERSKMLYLAITIMTYEQI